jgi:ankyrin repeat/BTB/POZ domain-containing protein 1
MMDENGELSAEVAQAISSTVSDEAIDVNGTESKENEASATGNIRTLDGDLAGDEFASDAINYQVLLSKIDRLLERLKLDA